MNTTLVIKHNDGDCDSKCMFLEGLFLHKTGKCRLFNEPLRPNMADGEIYSWKQCARCYDSCTSSECE